MKLNQKPPPSLQTEWELWFLKTLRPIENYDRAFCVSAGMRTYRTGFPAGRFAALKAATSAFNWAISLRGDRNAIAPESVNAHKFCGGIGCSSILLNTISLLLDSRRAIASRMANAGKRSEGRRHHPDKQSIRENKTKNFDLPRIILNPKGATQKWITHQNKKSANEADFSNRKLTKIEN